MIDGEEEERLPVTIKVLVRVWFSKRARFTVHVIWVGSDLFIGPST